MGSGFSSHIDRSHCVEKGLFEPWPMVAVVAAACRTMEIAKAEAQKNPHANPSRKPWESPVKTAAVHLRDVEIQRVQFHDTFVDFSYILPLLSKSVDKAMEFREKEIAAEAAERGEEVPEDDEQEQAAKARERNERIAALTGAFKGLKDEIFDLFVANPIVPKQVGGKLLEYSKESKDGKDSKQLAPGIGSDGKEHHGHGHGHKDHEEDAPESLNTIRIRAIEVLVVLTVMCKSTPMQKLSMLYCLFSDNFDWRIDRAMDQVWLYAKSAIDCADSIRCSLRGQQLHDLLLTAGISMRRVGMSVADVPFHAVDLESAALSLPRSATLPALKRSSRGIRRFKAAADVIRHAIRAGIVGGVLNTARSMAAAQAAEEGADKAYKEGLLLPSTSEEGGNTGVDDGEGAEGAEGGIVVAGTAARKSGHENDNTARTSLSMEGLSARLSKSEGAGGGFATIVEAAMAAAAKEKLLQEAGGVDGGGSVVTEGASQVIDEGENGSVLAGTSSSVEGEGSLVSVRSGAGSSSSSKPSLSLNSPVKSGAKTAASPSSPTTRRTKGAAGSPRPGDKGGAASKAGASPGEHGNYGGLSDDDRLTRLRQLYCENLDDDGPLAAQFVMVKRIHEAEEAAANAQAGPFQPGRNRFRFLRGTPFLVQAGSTAVGVPNSVASGAQGAGASEGFGGSGSSRGMPAPLRRGGSTSNLEEDGSSSPTTKAGGKGPNPMMRSATVAAGMGAAGAGGAGANAGAGGTSTAIIPFSGQVNSSLLPLPNVTSTGIEPTAYQPNDVEWSFALASTFFTAPERWRRLVGARKKAIANIPGGRTIRAQAVMWDYYAASDSIITSLATDLAVDIAEAKLCLSLHEQEQAMIANKQEAFVTARNNPSAGGLGMGGLGGPQSSLGMPGAGAAGAGAPGAGGRRASIGGAGAMTTVPPGAALRTITDAQVAQANDVLKKMNQMYRAPVTPHLFFDWVCSHPVPRYIMRQLAFPMGRVATYDGLDGDVPPADARHKNKTANPTASMSKGEQTRLLSRLIALTGLTIHDLRPLRTLYIQTVGNFGMSFDQFRRFVGDFIANVGQIRKEEGMMFSLAKAKREEALAAGLIPGGPGWPEGMPIELPPSPPPPPAFVNMPEPQRRKLLLKLFSCFDVNGDNSVDMAEFSVGVSRVMHGSAVDKLTLIFDVYDADGDGSVTATELTNIMLRALKLAEANSEDDEPEKDEVLKKQEDLAFAAELAEALDINGDGDISREEFFLVLRNEPLMYECFATSLGLPIGGLDDDEGMDIATAAKTGPIFDFKMLRLIRDRYSIDITKNRGPAQEEVKKPKAGAAGDAAGRERSDSRDSNDSFSGIDARPATGRGDKKGDSKEEEDEDAAMEEGKDDDDDEGGNKASKEKDNGKTSILERAVDRHHFRRLLRDLWKCPESALFLSDRIFEFLDEDGSGSMDVKELYQGITGALRGDIEQRANFFYSLFDTEGLGHMKSDQIMRMLMATAGTEDVTEEDARAVLEKIDADGSGTVELEEFMEAVQDDPGIIDALSRIFGRQGGGASSMFAGAKDGNDDGLDPDDLDGTGGDHHHQQGHGHAAGSGDQHGKDKDNASTTGPDVGHAGDRNAEDTFSVTKEEALNSVQAGTNRKGARIFVRQGTVVLAGPPSPSAATTAAALAGTLGASGSMEKLSPDKTVAPAIGVVANRRQMTMTRRSTIGGSGSLSPARSPSPARRDGALGAEGSLSQDSQVGGLSPVPSPSRKHLGSIASMGSVSGLSPARRLGGNLSPNGVVGETGSVVQLEGEGKRDDASVLEASASIAALLSLSAKPGSSSGLAGGADQPYDPNNPGSASARFSQNASLTSLLQGATRDAGRPNAQSAAFGNSIRRMLGSSAASLPPNGLLAGLLHPHQQPLPPTAVGGVVMMGSTSSAGPNGVSISMTPSLAVTSLNYNEAGPLPVLSGGLEALSPAVGAIMTGGLSRVSLLPGSDQNHEFADDDGAAAEHKSGDTGRSPKSGKKARGSAALVPPLSLAIAAASPGKGSGKLKVGSSDRKDGEGSGAEDDPNAGMSATMAAVAAAGGATAASQLRESMSIVSRTKAAMGRLNLNIGNMEKFEEQLKTAREEREERESDPLLDGGPDPLLLLLRAQLAQDRQKAAEAAAAAKESARTARSTANAQSPRAGGFSPDLKGAISPMPNNASAGSPRPARSTVRGSQTPRQRTALAGESTLGAGSNNFGASAAIQQAARLDMRVAAAGSVASGVSGLDSTMFGSSAASTSAYSPPNNKAGGKGDKSPTSKQKTPGRPGSAGPNGASKSGGKSSKKPKYINEGEEGPARWYKDDPDVRTLLKTAMESAKTMETTHEHMLNEKNAMQKGEKEVLHHLQAMVIKKKLREIAERRAQLAKMITDAHTGKGGGAMAALASGDGGFVQGSKLRVAQDEELPLSVANALSATKKYETAVSSLKQDLEEDVSGPGAGLMAASMDAASAAADALPEGALLPNPPHTFAVTGNPAGYNGKSGFGGIRSPLSATLNAAGGAVGALAGGNNRGPVGGAGSPGSPTGGAGMAGVADLRNVAAQEAWQRNILKDLADAEAQHAQLQAEAAAHAAAYHELGASAGGGHDEGEQPQYYGAYGGQQNSYSAPSMFHQQAAGTGGSNGGSQQHSAAQAALYAHALQGLQQHQRQRSVSPSAGPHSSGGSIVADPSSVRFPTTVSSVGQTMSPLLNALGVRPSALRSPGLKYPVPSGASPSAAASPAMGLRTLQHPASPLGFSPSATNTVGSVIAGGGSTTLQSPTKGGAVAKASAAGHAAGVRPSPASKAAGQMLMMGSPTR